MGHFNHSSDRILCGQMNCNRTFKSKLGIHNFHASVTYVLTRHARVYKRSEHIQTEFDDFVSRVPHLSIAPQQTNQANQTNQMNQGTSAQSLPIYDANGNIISLA
jgi:hypothetical protein